MTLHYQAPGFALHQGDCCQVMPALNVRFDLVVADPPYFLSSGGTTCQGGERTSVDKGDWDAERPPEDVHAFNVAWLEAAREVMAEDGTIFVFGTHHNIYSCGLALQQLGFRVLNHITWIKPTAPPNLGCRCFTHDTEQIIWASRSSNARHTFNYDLMKEENGGVQMRTVWRFSPPGQFEKRFGKHPTQKPLALTQRLLQAAASPGAHVLDPFCGAGTTGIAAARLNCSFTGIDLNIDYLNLAQKRHQHPYSDGVQLDLMERLPPFSGGQNKAILGISP